MTQKDTLSSLIHGNFAKELSISDGKMPPNAVEFERLVIGTFLIDKKGLDYSIDLLTPEAVADAVATSQLDAVPALAARGDLEFFFTQLMARNAALVGGKLPEAGFYAAPASA